MNHPSNSQRICPFQTLVSGLERVALRHGVPHPDCQDCAQEAFLALVIAHPDWPILTPRTIAWARGVVRYKALIYHRQRRQHPSVSLEEMGYFPLDRQFLPLQPAFDRDDAPVEIASKIPDLLGHLSEVNRQIIIRRVQEDRSFAEIGDALGLTANQVKARFLRAVKSLRQHGILSCNIACMLGGRNRRRSRLHRVMTLAHASVKQVASRRMAASKHIMYSSSKARQMIPTAFLRFSAG